MRRLLPLLILLLSLPAAAGLFDPLPKTELGAPLNNSSDFLPVADAFQLRQIQRTPDSINLQFNNAEGYYLYRHRFAIVSDDSSAPLGELQLPKGKAKFDEYFGDVEVYYGILDFNIPLSKPYDKPFTLQVTYQGCADKGLCYPPETARLTIDPSATDPQTEASLSQPISSHSPAAATSAAIPALPATHWEWNEFLLFFLAGIGLTFTPCVLPMLPILSGVVLRGQLGGMRGFTLSVAYVLPMAACFALLGALMGVFGAELNLQARLQSPWVLIPFAVFFGVFALAMFGVYELRLPRLISEPLDRLAGKTRGGSLWGAALLGVLSSLLVSPCVSAPLAGALLYISSSGDALGGGLKLFSLGLGMGAPMVLFATGGGRLLPKGGQWLVSVRNGFGVLLLAVAIWLLERVLPGPASLALWGLLAAGVALQLGTLEFGVKTAPQRLAQLAGLVLLIYAASSWVGALRGESNPLRPLGHTTSHNNPSNLPSQQWLTVQTPEAVAAALASAKANNQPLALDIYADWCISCKVIEREVLTNPAVQDLLKGYQLLRFDMTASSPEQRALLDHYQLFGPPAILLFSATGDEWLDLRVVGEVDAAEMATRLQQATKR